MVARFKVAVVGELASPGRSRVRAERSESVGRCYAGKSDEIGDIVPVRAPGRFRVLDVGQPFEQSRDGL